LEKNAVRFDKDSDGALDSKELQAWLQESPCDVELNVQLTERGLPRVEARVTRSPRVTPPSDPSPRRWQVVLDGMDLEASASNNRYMARDSVSLTKIRFRQSDADSNGYLSEGEFPGLQLNAPFSAVDLNGDGMLMLDEIDAYARELAQLSQSQIVLTISDDVTSLFQLMDGDMNRRLTPRELLSINTRLPAYDRNGNGRFDPSDFLSRYRLSFAFGVPAGLSNLAAPQEMVAMATRRPRAQRIGPLWFQKMDRNRDLDITWREFLGPRSAFDALDTNGDGLIDKDEAEAAQSQASAETSGDR
jgi:Ca2+-binding EF-hand superfamily protein